MNPKTFTATICALASFCAFALPIHRLPCDWTGHGNKLVKGTRE